jgi:hypothetical protein
MPIWTGAVNNNWSNAGNWAADGTGSGVPTQASDAVFSSTSAVNCTIDVVGGAVCRNLNFNGGTGYVGTITMTNSITVGSTAVANHSVTLSAGMGINPAGTGAISTRSNGNTSLRSNGRIWPNAFGINNAGPSLSSTVTLLDNWTISGNLFIGSGGVSVITFSGAFTINAGASVTLQISGTNARIVATAGSISTIRMTGTGTYSSSGITANGGLGLNLTIDAPGQTVTLANGSGYGGVGAVAGSTFSYVAGTVVSVGTFYLYTGIQTAATYTVNLFGSNSTSATTTSSTGVNFNDLDIRTNGVSGSQTINITGNICVVGNLSTTPAFTKGPFLTSGGTIYLNGNFTHVAGMRATSSTVLVLQGTSVTYSEVNAVTTVSAWGISWQVQINTTGSVTISSIIGFRNNGSLTYTAGAVTFASGASILAGISAAFYGLGSGGVTIPAMEHPTNSTGISAGTILYFYDTVPCRILTFSLTGATSNFTFTHKGTIGWDCDSLTCILQPGSTGSVLRLLPLVEYKIRTSLIMRSWSTVIGNAMTVGTDPTSVGSTIFTLLPGASQDMFVINGGVASGPVNSSNGQTIYTRSGLINVATLNWRNWDFPRTRQSTSIS